MTYQAPPPSAGWQQPTPGYGAYPTYAQQRPGTSGLAIASLICGLAFWCFLVPGIVAIVLGNLALEQIEDSHGMKTGRGMAIAGIVLGWFGIAMIAVTLVVWILALVSSV